MRAFTPAVLCLALTAVTVILVAPSASADTPSCATRTEFGHIDRGMSITRVTHILDIRGSSTGSYTDPNYRYTSRLYTKCGSVPALATVKYKKPRSGGTWRVTSKSW